MSRRSPAVLLAALVLLSACGDRDDDRWTVREGDCDDRDHDVRPTAPEVCANGIDDDCDGLVDGDDPEGEGWVEAWADADGDGFGGTYLGWGCDVPAFTEATDCDDGNSDVSPLGTEVCGDGLDNDCDGGSRECEGIGAAEDIHGADAAYFVPSPYGRASDVIVAGPCGDLDGDGAADVAMLMELSDYYYYGYGPYYYGPEAPLRSWLTIAAFDASARGTLTAADAWARPVDNRETVELGLWGVAFLCSGDSSGDGRSELTLVTEGVGGLGSGIHVLGAPDRGDLTPDVRATWNLTYLSADLTEVARAGDADGDGAADLLVTVPYTSYDDDDRVAFLLPGGPAGDHTEADALAVFRHDGQVASVGRCAGEDADGDGIPDVAFGVDDRVYVFLDPPAGDHWLADADVVADGEEGSYFGARLAWLADPAVGAARLVVYDGVARGDGPISLGLFDLRGDTLELTAAVTGEGDLEPGEGFSVGDIDGDGVAELGVSVYDGARFVPPPREGTVDLADARMGLSGWAVQPAAAGDVDGDGDGDLLASFYSPSGEGYAGLWLGGPPQ